jgi:hypothetical protein
VKFAHYKSQDQVAEAVSAFNTGIVNFTGGAFPEQLKSARVSQDFFRLFGATPPWAAPSAPMRTFPAAPGSP